MGSKFPVLFYLWYALSSIIFPIRIDEKRLKLKLGFFNADNSFLYVAQKHHVLKNGTWKRANIYSNVVLLSFSFTKYIYIQQMG